MRLTVKQMAEMAMLVALALILDNPALKIKIGANGGSISLTTIPLFVLCLRLGVIKGFIGVGLIYGMASFLQDGELAISIPFDYILAYGSIAIVGLFRKQILVEKITVKSTIFLVFSIVFACFLRFTSHTISSLIFWDFSLLPALLYNILYMGPTTGVAVAAMLLLYKPLVDINKRHPIKSI